MIYDVEFSLESAAELLRISEVLGSAVLVLQEADSIRRQLENDPTEKGEYLPRVSTTLMSSLFVRFS